jgi:hypothetical protein
VYDTKHKSDKNNFKEGIILASTAKNVSRGKEQIEK